MKSGYLFPGTRIGSRLDTTLDNRVHLVPENSSECKLESWAVQAFRLSMINWNLEKEKLKNRPPIERNGILLG